MKQLRKSELVQEDLGYAIIHKDKVKYKSNFFRCVLDLPVDEPLCEIIEEFGIPVIRKKGLNYKIRFVTIRDIRNSLDLEKGDLNHAMKKIVYIHPKEKIEKRAYNKQIRGLTQFTLIGRALGGSSLNLVSIADAIQILSILERKGKKRELIRKLIIKIEELQEKINKQQKEEINDCRLLLKQFDIVCYDWIKEHQESVIYKGEEVFGNFAGFIRLWDHELWQIIIDIRYKIRRLLGLPVPKKENAGLHHSERPYRTVYPHVATKGQIIDKRWDHEDPRQKKFTTYINNK